jgi:hypothetical protein
MERDDYIELLVHERHIEGRAYTALGHFLAANAFMYTAWATLYAVNMEDASHQTRIGMDIVLAGSAVVGYFWGLLWSSLGRRSWSMARRLVMNLHEVGSRRKNATSTMPHLYEILSTTEIDGRDPSDDPLKARFKLSSNPSILSFAPLMMSAIYVALFVLWFLGRFTPPDAWLLIWCGVAMVGLIWIGVLVVCGIVAELCLEKRVTAAMREAGIEVNIERLWAKFPKAGK